MLTSIVGMLQVLKHSSYNFLLLPGLAQLDLEY